MNIDGQVAEKGDARGDIGGADTSATLADKKCVEDLENPHRGNRSPFGIDALEHGIGDEIPPFAYRMDCTKLLFRHTAEFDEEEGVWEASDPRRVEFEKLSSELASRPQSTFRPERV